MVIAMAMGMGMVGLAASDCGLAQKADVGGAGSSSVTKGQ